MASYRDQLRSFNVKNLTYEELVDKLTKINEELEFRNNIILRDIERGDSREKVCERYGISRGKLRQLIYRRKRKWKYGKY